MMKKILWIIVALWLAGGIGRAEERDSLLVMFWNVENFFEASAKKGWTKKRFYAKCNAIASTILLSRESFGRVPDVVAFAEVGSRAVLGALTGGTLLRKLGYRIVHYESPDRRGIDCALLYRVSSLVPVRSSPQHLFAADGSVMRTRDILVVEFPGLDILVNHHPSKVGDGGGDRRRIAMDRMRFLCDSLRSEGHPSQFCVGDFNDDVWGGGGEGTIKYNGSWEKIDGYFAFGALDVSETVFHPAFLSEPDKAFGGLKPRRTFVGPAYCGGVSDHYPVICKIVYSF